MDLLDLFVKIVLDTSDYEEGVEDAREKTSGFADQLKTGLATAAKVGAAALGTATVAFGALGKAAISNYADYEQLVGGVETLFKTSADTVMEYANNAYKTAGFSANAYMETVTSFSASLLAGLDGDTAAAADVANRAITDMSDNANKMGTDISMLQNAYQGFAKQNYTMLDNLKLGFGGTAGEMARLVNESGVLGEGMTVTAESINSVSFDKIIEAIGVVQDRMGITGTTATEASTTIQGSISSMKAAWTNFVTGMADPNQDFDALLGNLINSVVTASDNLVPRIMDTLPRLAEGIAQLGSGLMPHITETITTLLPTLMSGSASLLESFTSALPGIIEAAVEVMPQLVEAAINILDNLINAIVDNLPLIVTAALQIMAALIRGLMDAIPDLIMQIPRIINAIEVGLKGGLPDMLDVGRQLLMGLWEGIQDKVEWLKGKVAGVVDKIKSWFTGSEGFDEHSPSRWAKQVFQYVMEGGVQGLDAGAPALYRDIEGITAGVKDRMQMGSVAFSDSSVGIASAGIVNGLSSAMGDNVGSAPITINLMLPDGTKFATWQLPYLIRAAAANGTPIANPQMA